LRGTKHHITTLIDYTLKALKTMAVGTRKNTKKSGKKRSVTRAPPDDTTVVAQKTATAKKSSSSRHAKTTTTKDDAEDALVPDGGFQFSTETTEQPPVVNASLSSSSSLAAGDEEVQEIAQNEPPLTAAEIEAKALRRKARQAQKIAAEKEHKAKAVKLGDSKTWPLPLTRAEAKEATIAVNDTFDTKNGAASKIMALCERDQKRFVSSISRPVRLQAKCPYPDCKFLVDCAFHTKKCK
jgi:hypothetical protein